MRTFDEIQADVSDATSINDAVALLRLAVELDELVTPEATAIAHNARGWACHCTGEYPAALEHFYSALALHKENGNRSGVAGVTSNIGNVYVSTGDYPAALEHFNRALALHKEIGNRSGVASVTIGIGNVYNDTGNYPAALEHFNCALALNNELGNRRGVATVTGNIGNVYSSTGDYPAALEYLNSALALHHELGDHRGVARTTSNIGRVYGDMEDQQSALEHFRRALTLFDTRGDNGGVVRTSGNIVMCLIRSGQYSEAEAMLRSMDAIQIDHPWIFLQREHARASIQEHQGDLDGSARTLHAALERARTHNIAAIQAATHRSLRDLALRQNDLARYVEHNNEFTRINEEIRGKATSIKLAMQAKEREIAEREKETAKQIAVLHSTLPKHIADRVARGEVVNDHYDNAAVLFLDIVGFTSISDRIPAGHVVHLLDQIFTALDALCEKHDVTKIKTIGDSYMAVGFEGNTAERMAQCALDMISTLNDMVITMPPALGDTSWTKDVGDIRVRIGLHCGPVTAGVIGTQRMQYDVWGDTVNTASRMEGSSLPGRVHVSRAFVKAIEKQYRIQNTEFNDSMRESENALMFVERGEIDVKGKGAMTTYWLEQA